MGLFILFAPFFLGGFALCISDGDADLPQHLLVDLADRCSQRPDGDVYKRQAVHMDKGILVALALDTALALGEVSGSPRTVSYTHLDGIHILTGRTVKQGHRRFAQHKGIFREGLVLPGLT